MRREDRPGYLWIIDIPKGFWGARDIRDISDKAGNGGCFFCEGGGEGTRRAL